MALWETTIIMEDVVNDVEGRTTTYLIMLARHMLSIVTPLLDMNVRRDEHEQQVQTT